MLGQLLTGRYLILEKLGAGGFSETYLARDKYLPHHPLCVAKCLKLSPTNTIPLSTAQRLFETEAQVLNELGQHHAQIPTLLAYSHDQEMAYQIQKYVEGKNLGQWATQERRFTSEAAIALLMDVLPVLQYVHSHHIVHRDIKPSNLIQSAETNQIVLIDFGAACRMVNTAAGWRPEGEDADLAIGTPGYMPKEQQSGKLQFNSDLYALGISVIFLLTGVHPRKLEYNPISGELDWQVQLGDRTIHPGLATVLSGMVRHRASDRFASVTEVMNAMSAFVSFQPVAPSQPVVLRPHKPLRQRWLGLVGRSLLMTGVVCGLLGGGYYYAQSRPLPSFMSRLGMGASHSRSHLTQLQAMVMPSAVQHLAIAPGEREMITAHADQVFRLWSLTNGKLLKTLSGDRDPVTALSLSQDGEWLLSGGRDRVVQLWQLAAGRRQRQFTGHTAPVTAVAFSPHAQTFASGSEDGTVRIWNRQTGTRQQTLARYGAAITAIAYGKSSDVLISANSKFEIQIWNLQTRRLQRTFAGHTAPIRWIQMVDADTFVSVGDDRVLVWNLQQEELLRVSPKHPSPIVAASIRDRRVLTVNQRGQLQTWNLDTGKTEVVHTPDAQPTQATFSPSGRYLLAWNRDRQLTLWQYQSQP